MDELFEYPVDSMELLDALDVRIQEAERIVEASKRPLSGGEYERELASWEIEIEPLGDSLLALLDAVADEVEAAMSSGESTSLGGLLALRMMMWARERMQPGEEEHEENLDITQLNLDLRVFVCGWQYLKLLE